MSRPRIAITMGDPAGVGPEVCLDLLANPEIEKFCIPLVFGDYEVLKECAAVTGKPSPPAPITSDQIPSCDQSAIVQIDSIHLDDFNPGAINAATGQAGYDYIIQAINLAKAGIIDGITTAPINKEALHAAGHRYPGHTEIFAEETETPDFCMMLTTDELTCSFVTVHVGYHEVPQLLSSKRILEVIELTRKAMRRMRGHEPKLVVCGLNPHAGENGLFGNREEENIITPAIEQARELGADITGPLPPDTAFLDWRRAETDAHICMYHDQGHIIMKALAFDKGINTTLGLPIVRTSVDHGTALDIAWQGKANPSSLYEAVNLAAKLSRTE